MDPCNRYMLLMLLGLVALWSFRPATITTTTTTNTANIDRSRIVASVRPVNATVRRRRLEDARPESPWSFDNYTKPNAHAEWPRCSRPPNCLPRGPALQGACAKWKNYHDYPVLVGDMDGSGSRGVTWLLKAGGVHMKTTNMWMDWATNEHGLSNRILDITHSADYDIDQLPGDVRKDVTAQVSKVLNKQFKVTVDTLLPDWNPARVKKAAQYSDPGHCPMRAGWKHGPLVFLLPVYNAVTARRFTFVHLIRDGRDMAFSRNRNNLAKYSRFGGQVVGLFKLKKNYNDCFFSSKVKHSVEQDRECMTMQMRLWERMNVQASQYGQREMADRYVPLRVEDLIIAEDAIRIKTIEHFFRRLGMNHIDHRLAEKLMDHVFGGDDLASHFSYQRWGGCDDQIKDQIEQAGADGLRYFGYDGWRDLLAQQEKTIADGGNPITNGCSLGAHQIQVPGQGGKRTGK